ncbi:MAG: hypothetical protein FJW36_22070 [Acidobacteria bacterium]|nr:hypothetical protein [Acidobacteriota bacterium]
MNTISSRKLVLIAMIACLAFCTVIQASQPSMETSVALTETASNSVAGGLDWGCGLLVGAVGAVVAIGVGGATLGFGGALAISATIHVGAIACAI